MLKGYARRGRHRAPSTTGRTAARLAVTSLAVVAPAALAPPAQAASDSTWDKLAQCESGGNWSINTGNSFYGGLQHSARTWDAFKGAAGVKVDRADHASRSQQIAVAERVLAAQGWGAWPACSRKLGLREGATPRASPATKHAPAPTPAARPAPVRQRVTPNPRPRATGDYRVKPGDTLSGLVGARWPKVCADNRLADCDLILVGQRLDLTP